MKKQIVIFSCLFNWVLTGCAGFQPIEQSAAVSPNGESLIRIVSTASDSIDSNPFEMDWEVRVYSRDKDSDVYNFTKSLYVRGDFAPSLCYINDTSDRLILIDITVGSSSVRVYNITLDKHKEWKLCELLSEEEINSIATISRSLQWFEEGWFFNNNTFYFKGPSKRARQVLSGSLDRPTDPDLQFCFRIGLDETGEIERIEE